MGNGIYFKIAGWVDLDMLQILGIYKVRNEIETKRNQRKRNEINENETKSTKWKRNQRKQYEIDWYEENGRKKIKDKMK